MKNIQQWDKYETALLINFYILVEQDKYTEQEGCKILSQYLRSRALYLGYVIDDKFRNHNGIALMFAAIKFLFTDGRKGIPGASKVFKEMYIMYVNNREDFNKILEIAYDECRKAEVDTKIQKDAMSEVNSVINPEKNKFKNWLLTNQISGIEDNVIIDIIDTCNKIAQKGSIITKKDNIWTMSYGITFKNIVYKFKKRYDYISANYDSKGLYDKVIDKFVQYKEFIGNTKYNPNKSITVPNINSTVVKQNTNNATVVPNIDSTVVKQNTNSSFKEYFIDFLNDKFPENYFSNIEKYIKIINFTGADVLNRKFDCLGDNDISNINYVRKIVARLSVVTNGNSRRANSVLNLVQKIYDGWNKNNKKAYSTKNKLEQVICKDNDIKILEKISTSKKDGSEGIKQDVDKASEFYDKQKTYLDFLATPKKDGSEGIKQDVDRAIEIYDKQKIYIDFLATSFPNGFRIGSGIELKKFRRKWEERFGRLEENDKEIEKNIVNVSIIVGKMAYLIDEMMTKETKNKLFSYINDRFNNGENIIYYDALFKYFQNDFLEGHINDAAMLEEYLRKTNDLNMFVLKERFFMAKNSGDFNLGSAIRKYLIEIGVPVKTENIVKELSHISENQINNVLSGTGSSEFVNNKRGEYFHISIVDLSNHEIDKIKTIIENELNKKNFISSAEVWNNVNKKYPSMLEPYPYLTILGLRGVLASVFKGKFSFNGPIITRCGEELSLSDVFANFARNNHHFTLEQLNELKNELGSVIYFEDIYSNSIRINEEEFIAFSDNIFDVEKVDTAIDVLCPEGFTSVTGIFPFSGFPYCGYSWNCWLLESYLTHFSKKYRLLHSSYNANNCVGAVVKKEMNITTFDDLLALVLANSNLSKLDKQTALQYWTESGYLARRSYSNVEKTIIKANHMRITYDN